MTTKAKHIMINCEYTEVVPLDDLYSIQADLKKISKRDARALRSAIVRNGLCFPVYCWKAEAGRYYIIDGVHRVQACRELVNDEGYTLDGVPVLLIPCKDMRDAKRKLLYASSRYAKVDKQGFIDYLAGAGLNAAELAEQLSSVDFGFAELLFDDEVLRNAAVAQTPGRKRTVHHRSEHNDIVSSDDLGYVVYQLVFDDEKQVKHFWDCLIRVRALRDKSRDYRDVLLDSVEQLAQQLQQATISELDGATATGKKRRKHEAQ